MLLIIHFSLSLCLFHTTTPLAAVTGTEPTCTKAKLTALYQGKVILLREYHGTEHMLTCFAFKGDKFHPFRDSTNTVVVLAGTVKPPENAS